MSDDPCEERGAQPPGASQRERADGSDERADADRGVQVADAAVSEVEQLGVPRRR